LGQPPLQPDIGVPDEPHRDLVRHPEPQAIRRGSFQSVKELIAMIAAFTAQWNEGSTPFHWVKTADQIPAKAIRKPSATSESGH